MIEARGCWLSRARSKASRNAHARADAFPYVAQSQYDTGTALRRSNIDDSTTLHAGYPAIQRIRKRIEEISGWMKTVAGWGKTTFRGLDRTEWGFTLALAAYDLTRMPNLLANELGA